MALAWVLRQPGVTSALLGATRVEHLERNLQALEVKLTDREWLEVGRLANPRPARASRAGGKGEARPRAKK